MAQIDSDIPIFGHGAGFRGFLRLEVLKSLTTHINLLFEPELWSDVFKTFEDVLPPSIQKIELHEMDRLLKVTMFMSFHYLLILAEQDCFIAEKETFAALRCMNEYNLVKSCWQLEKSLTRPVKVVPWGLLLT